MNGFNPLAALAVISLLMAGCEGQLHSENKEQSLLAGPVVTTRPATASGEAEARGETAAVYGDDQTAVKLFERSYDEHPTVENAFNLAAAYARTAGRRKPSSATGRSWRPAR